MKVLLISYFFSPEVTPRAFRVSELALQFAHDGHQVEVLYPDKGFLCEKDLIHENINLSPVTLGWLGKRALVKKSSQSSLDTISRFSIKLIIKKIFKPVVNKLLPGQKDLLISFEMYKALKASKKDVDILISVGLPFSIHLVSYFGMKYGFLNTKYAFAEYGDPYSRSPTKEAFIFGIFLERMILKKFDKVIVPVGNAISAFHKIVPFEKISIIPQGFRINIRNSTLNTEHRRYFAYAGMFYPDIRNPSDFLNYLCHVETDFVFKIYTNIKNDTCMALLQPYIKVLGEKLEVHDLIPREMCIDELSKCHFLVNFLNYGGKQIPSKLIDYAMTGRPILNIESNSKNFNIFDEFINGNYHSAEIVDLNKYDIKLVSKQFIELTETMYKY